MFTSPWTDSASAPTNATVLRAANDATAAIGVIIGVAAGWAYSIGTAGATAIAGALILLKDIVDDADGQLARAKQLYSRRGRVLDSIGDFVVDVAVFAGIGWSAYRAETGIAAPLLALLGLAGITLRVPHHVFYQASFLHTEKRYGLNRIVEEVTDDDRRGDPVAFALQRVFGVIYGWQDRLMLRITAGAARGRCATSSSRPGTATGSHSA